VSTTWTIILENKPNIMLINIEEKTRFETSKIHNHDCTPKNCHLITWTILKLETYSNISAYLLHYMATIEILKPVLLRARGLTRYFFDLFFVEMSGPKGMDTWICLDLSEDGWIPLKWPETNWKPWKKHVMCVFPHQLFRNRAQFMAKSCCFSSEHCSKPLLVDD